MTTETKQDVSVSSKPVSETREVHTPSLVAPLEEAERMFERLLNRTWLRPMGWNWPIWSGVEDALAAVRVPTIDMIDRDADVLIRAEMPGVEKKDLDVSVGNSTLTVKGSTATEHKEQKQDYYRCEIGHGVFSRTLSIPSGVDSSKISATLKDGVLEIVLPKLEHVQRRAVPVK